MASKRLPIDFDVKDPKRMVTDPDRAEREAQGIPHDGTYPKHLVTPDLDGPGGPAHRALVIAQDAADEKRYRAQGYMSHQEADVAERQAQASTEATPQAEKLPKAPKPVAAKKPRNPKPAAKSAPEPAAE